MQNERETKVIETPFAKQKIEVVSYITGRDKQAMEDAAIDSGISIDPVTKQPGNITSGVLNKVKHTAWKTIVVSIDGKKDGQEGFSIVDAILNMRLEDYEFVVAEINNISGDSKFDQKKTS